MAQNEARIHTIPHGRVVGKIVEKKAHDGRVFLNVRISRPFKGENGTAESNLYSGDDLLNLIQVAQDAYSWLHANGRIASRVEIDDEPELD